MCMSWRTIGDMGIRRSRRGPTRAKLIQRKHDLEGQIAGLTADVRRARQRGEDATAAEARLERLQSEHHRTRLEIDRTDPDLD